MSNVHGLPEEARVQRGAKSGKNADVGILAKHTPRTIARSACSFGPAFHAWFLSTPHSIPPFAGVSLPGYATTFLANSSSTLLPIVMMLSLSFCLPGCRQRTSASEPNEMVLRHTLPSKVTTLDPAMIADTSSRIVASQLFEPLYEYHFLKRPYELVPLLAEDMPQISADGLTYTISIKRGVFFQDDRCFPAGKGRDLKAEDFVFSIKRIADVKSVSPNWSMFADRIVGLDSFRQYTTSCKTETDVDYSRQVEGLVTAGDYTLVIRLTRPWPQFIHSVLANVVSAPIPKEGVDYYGQDIVSHPIGTGPFKLNAWRRGSFVELGRNPTFRVQLYPSEGEPGDGPAGYLDDAGKKMPFADRVVWTTVEERQPAWLLFLKGEIDSVVMPRESYSQVLTANGELTDTLKKRGVHLTIMHDPSVYWVGFNMNDPVIGQNISLRLAISRAIDRQRLVELFFNNRHLIAHGLIPPAMPSYDPSIKDMGFARYDLDEAKQLLEQAKTHLADPLPVLKVALPGTDTWWRQFGQFIEHCLNELGLEVELRLMDQPTYQEYLNSGRAQLFAGGLAATIPDPLEFFCLFYGPNRCPGPNKFNYSNPAFDDLFEKAATLFDCPARGDLHRRMERLVLEECPAVLLNHRVAYVLHHDWYKNFKPHAFAYNLSKYRRIDRTKRAEYRKTFSAEK